MLIVIIVVIYVTYRYTCKYIVLKKTYKKQDIIIETKYDILYIFD